MRVMCKASKAMRYGSKALSEGESFEASRRDARVLVAVGKAALAQDDAPDEVVEQDSSDESKPKRKYRRRDMEARG